MLYVVVRLFVAVGVEETCHLDLHHPLHHRAQKILAPDLLASPATSLPCAINRRWQSEVKFVFWSRSNGTVKKKDWSRNSTPRLQSGANGKNNHCYILFGVLGCGLLNLWIASQADCVSENPKRAGDTFRQLPIQSVCCIDVHALPIGGVQ